MRQKMKNTYVASVTTLERKMKKITKFKPIHIVQDHLREENEKDNQKFKPIHIFQDHKNQMVSCQLCVVCCTKNTNKTKLG